MMMMMIVDSKQEFNNNDIRTSDIQNDENYDNREQESQQTTTLLSPSSSTKTTRKTTTKRIVYTATKIESKTNSNNKNSKPRFRDSSLPPNSELAPATSTSNRQQIMDQYNVRTVDDDGLISIGTTTTNKKSAHNNDDYYYESEESPQRRANSQSHNDLLFKQQSANNRQYHDNANSNGNNNSKVRLLVSPGGRVSGIGITTDRHGSKQQSQMVRSATIEPIQVRHQQLRSQQANRQKNYHHYDYFTDSDLSSSFAANNYHNNNDHQQATNHLNWNDNGNVYNCYDSDNILLFANEHNNDNNTNQQPVVYSNQRPHQLDFQQQQVGHYGNNNINGGSYRVVNNPTTVGRFVNYYPSWRQAQSPAAAQNHHQNYSFHVPLNSQQFSANNNYPLNNNNVYSTRKFMGSAAGANNQPPVNVYNNHSSAAAYKCNNNRYGFVAPANNSGGSKSANEYSSLNRSFKSRTIAHIPNMVKLSVEDSKVSNNNNYYYERPSNYSTTNGEQSQRVKQFIVSEGDLLQATATTTTSPTCNGVRKTMIIVDDGCDNPFKPNTELSWEADMMVRLMKRGYPVKELPILVQTAKEVAKEKQHSPAIIKDNDDDDDNNFEDNNKQKTYYASGKQAKSGEEKQAGKACKLSSRYSNSGEIKQQQKSPSKSSPIRRQFSISELSSGKQVWANSLSRTRSMPFRFQNNHNAKSDMKEYENNLYKITPSSKTRDNKLNSSANNHNNNNNNTYDKRENDDADSIDKLITNIENEMSELLRIEAEKSEEKRQQEGSSPSVEKNAQSRTGGGGKGKGKGNSLGSIASATKTKRKKADTNCLSRQGAEKKEIALNQTKYDDNKISLNNKFETFKRSENSDGKQGEEEVAIKTSNNKTKKILKPAGSNNAKKQVAINNKSTNKPDLISEGRNNQKIKKRKNNACCIIQ